MEALCLHLPVQTGICEIAVRRRSTMLLGNNMLDFERTGVVDIGQPAVFAFVSGSRADFRSKQLIHDGHSRRASVGEISELSIGG